MSREELNSFVSELMQRIGHHIYEHTFYEYTRRSGRPTEVYPIVVYHKHDTYEITIQLKGMRNYFANTIKSFKKRYKDITIMRYCRNDGSCPNTLLIVVKK